MGIDVCNLEAWIDSREPTRTRTTQKLQEHGLCLIVEGVRCCDGLKSLLTGQSGEPTVAQLAPRRLNTHLAGQGMLAHIGATGKKLQSVVPRQIRDERLVRFRIRPAQPVIEVR